MKQNAAQKAIDTLNAQIAVLQQARNAITEALDSQVDESPSADKPKRGRPRRKGLPNADGSI